MRIFTVASNIKDNRNNLHQKNTTIDLKINAGAEEMSRIFGTNDPIALEERKFPFFQIQVWKGGKKQDYIYTDKRTGEQKKGQKYGNDLGLEFRIELNTNSPKNNSSSALVKSQQITSIKDILKQSYKAKEDENGSLFVDYLNIIPYCDDPNISFFSALATYKNNRPQWFCDKKNIHTKFIGKRGRPVKVKEPCHAKSIYDDCSKGCREFGSFYFEILELQMLNITRVCKLQVTAIEDIINISQFLDKTKKQLGAIRKSPFYSTRTKNFIVYRLSRHAKQNSYKKLNYPILLELHPLWANEYHASLSAKQIQSLGLTVPRKVLADIYGEELIEPLDVQTIDISGSQTLDLKILPPECPEWRPSSEDIDLARQIWRKNQWTEAGLRAMLRSHFGIDSLKEIRNLTQEQYYQFLAALGNNVDAGLSPSCEK